jgi:hypothetical protein
MFEEIMNKLIVLIRIIERRFVSNPAQASILQRWRDVLIDF